MDIKRAWKKLLMGQCRRPGGILGEYIGRRMNRSHFALTTWGLAHVAIAPDADVLDIGCGGGRTLERLAALAPRGRIHGIDASEKSVAMSRRHNAQALASGRMEVRLASVAALPFADATFDLATAVETHYFWPNLAADLAEVRRVLRPGGRLLVLGEVYDTPKFDARNRKWLELVPMAYLTVAQFRTLFETAGFTDIVIDEEADHGWICCVGKTPGIA
ncbi:MAG: class I SAM-dependent methyltransferase [Solidesulfovibrio sp. DCME]|uniref:class I SAM-dependent methyltransferase n=1 Tax=Solidesulfovibrio sp. DCME TaxID=3447380 RepID=UPI003D0F9A04